MIASAISPCRLAAFVLVLALFSAGPFIAGCAAAVNLYVAPDGNDEWTGRSPDAGVPDGPFATLGRAQAEARGLLAEGPPRGGVTVFVRAGTYELAEALTLGPEDSGAPNSPVLYRAFEGETPVLVGARKVTGFAPWRDGIMRADLKGTPLEGIVFRQLFFNGERQVMARYPNVDPDDPHFGQWAHVTEVDGPNVRDSFGYAPGVEKNWTNVQHAEVGIHPGYDWAWNIIPIKSVDREAGRIHLARNTSYDLRIGDRYYVQNILEELDAPGEWHLDRDASTLYFMPPGDLGEGDVLAPVLSNVVVMREARYVTVQGFVIEACDGDAVQIQDSEDCAVLASVIRNCGSWGVRIWGGMRSGAFGNDIYATGAGGISLSGGDRRTLARGDNFATNNYVHHVGNFARTYNTGVNISGVGNIADHNLIHDTYHAGMTLGGNENVVEFNHVHHTNLGSADTGGIYFCSRDWTQRGNIIRHNIFRNVGGFGKRNSWAPVQDGKVWFEYPHFTWGIYLDDPTTGTLVYGNILWSVPICGLHNHGGRDNTFENNIIVDCPAFRAGELSPNWSEWPPIKERLAAVQYEDSPYLRMYPELADYQVERPEEMSGLRFLRNIVYYTEEGTRWLREKRASAWRGTQEMYGFRMSPEDFEVNEWEGNVVYAPETVEVSIALEMPRGVSRRLTWDEWQALGKDTTSEFADPLFVDPENRDYRLRPESPALRLGFRQIPVERIGPFEDPMRASWPIVKAPGAWQRGEFVTERFYQLPGHEPAPAHEFVARDGLGNFFSKLAAGEAVRVVYFGGGIHSAGGWPAQVIAWLREQYPGAEIDYVHAGICDCSRGSGFSVYRFAHDVLRREPDLVLVDFASDDHQTEQSAVMRNIEGVVRQAWRADPTIDILLLYAFREGFEAAYADGVSPGPVTGYERVAEHCAIPSVNMGVRIAAMARDDELVIKASEEEERRTPGRVVFSREGVRPTEAAQRIYAEVITEALEQLGADPAPLARELQAPLRADNLERATLFAITPDMLEGDWERLSPTDVGGRNFSNHFEEVWFTNTPGAKLTFKFRGSDASMFNLMGPDTGRARVTVNGEDRGVRQQVDPWAYYQRLSGLSLVSGLDPDAEHTVTVELLPDAPDRSVPMQEAQRANRYVPEDFEGVALRFGWLRIVGEVVQ